MNVRIPLKASSKCVESGNHTESVGIFEIAVQVVIVLVISDLAVERHIKYTKKIKLNARRHNVKFRSIQII